MKKVSNVHAAYVLCCLRTRRFTYWQSLRQIPIWLLLRTWRLISWISRQITHAICWFWSTLFRVGTWLWYHLLSPILCLGCIYGGVCLSMLLPVSLWVGIVHPAGDSLAGLLPTPPTAFPLADLPAPADLRKALLAALPLAVHVFATGAHRDWQQRRGSLGVRMLYACHAGIIWWRAWFPERTKAQGKKA